MTRVLAACFVLGLFGCGQGPPSEQQGGGFVDAAAKGSGMASEDATDGATASPEAAACDRHLPTCPATPPSYRQDVAPIMMSECAPCHYPGSAIARGVFTTYAQLQAGRGSVLNEVYACKMPVAPVPPLSPGDRTTLLTWIECGGPNN